MAALRIVSILMDSAAIDSFRWSNSLEARFDFNLSLSTSFLILLNAELKSSIDIPSVP